MPTISSSATPYFKILFPTIWFGFLAFAVANVLAKEGLGVDFMLFVVVGIMAVFGLQIMKHMLWNLADEVRDGGDFLVVRFRRQEENIQFANIMNVSIVTASSPPRITLRLVNPGLFGNEIAFMPRATSYINPFAKNEICEDLMMRAYMARVQSPD